MRRGALAILALGLGGCGALLPKIPVASEERRVVSLDGRGGLLCGTFDTGEAFCGGRVLELPYDDLNARSSGRALQVSSTDGTTCILFESGDVGCATVGVGWSFVDRPPGVAFQSIVVGAGFGCGIDAERYVDCWGMLSQHRGESLLESTFKEEGGRPSRRDGRDRASNGAFRVHGLSDVRQLRGAFNQLCALVGEDVICTQISKRGMASAYGYDGGFGDGELRGGDGFGSGMQDGDPEGACKGSDEETGFPSWSPQFGGCTSRSDDPFWSGQQAETWVLEEPRLVEVPRARSIASFGSLGCAADADDRITCWGDAHLPLALRSMRDKAEKREGKAMEIVELAGASTIELGNDHGCALSTSSGPRADPRSIVAETNKGPERAGELWCWGENDSGQLGNAVNAGSSLPVRVQGLDDVDAFAVAQGATCALSDGELWCWGRLGPLPELEHPEDDPCLDPKAVCVPHRVKGFEAAPVKRVRRR